VASPRPNPKKSFTQQGHKGRKEIPYQAFKTDCSVSIRFVFAALRGLVVNYSVFVLFCENPSSLCGLASLREI
jgi:hypothetical protein